MPLDERLAAQSVCDLETVGRRSGQPRRIEVWFAADPQRVRIYLLAGGRYEAHWVRNVMANPRVLVQIGGHLFVGEAHVIEGTPGERSARELVGAKYGYWRPGRPLSGWARDALPVRVDLQAVAGPDARW